jgi:hypothetical protein
MPYTPSERRWLRYFEKPHQHTQTALERLAMLRVRQCSTRADGLWQLLYASPFKFKQAYVFCLTGPNYAHNLASI